MDLYLLIIIIFFSSVAFYCVHLFMPTKKKYKYTFCSLFILFGAMAWLYVWLGNGWLASAVYGTVSLILGVVLFVIAFLFDLFEKWKRVRS